MVIADPGSELIGLVRGMGDPAPSSPSASSRSAAMLIRRRFGLSLPPPYIGEPGVEEPVRVAHAVDGAAIAAVKWRVFGTTYRGLFSDRFLDARGVVPPVSYWTGRAMVPPSRRHRLYVWGRPGTVFGYLDCGPVPSAIDVQGRGAAGEPPTDEGAPTEGDGEAEVGEIFELYVDPSAAGRGGGGRLLNAAEAWLGDVGLSALELSVLDRNAAAREFYERHGWTDSGVRLDRDLSTETIQEARYQKLR